MTRKHFIKIADITATHIKIGNTWTALHTLRSLLWNMEQVFIEDNPRFDSYRFNKKIGLNLCRRCMHTLPFPEEHIKHQCQE